MRNKSDENWRVGQRCLDDGNLNAAANRLYYAVFQAVLAYAKAKLGYKHDPDIGAHSRMRSCVSNNLGQNRVRVFVKMMSLRETADYEPETPPEPNIRALMVDSENIRQYFLKQAES